MKFKAKYITGFVRLLCFKAMNGNRMKCSTIFQFFGQRTEVNIANASLLELGHKNYFSSGCYIGVHDKGSCKIGNNNFFNRNVHIECLEDISIGDNNLFGPNIVMVDHDHRTDDITALVCKQGYVKKKIRIGNDVWIGANVTICKGVTICDHAIIGANSVVTKDINVPGVYCGIPAQKRKGRI